MQLDDWLDSNLKGSLQALPVPERKKDVEQKEESMPDSSPAASFLDRWVRNLFISSKSKEKPQKKTYRREVRSAFGWTDIPNEENEGNDLIEEEPVNRQLDPAKLRTRTPSQAQLRRSTYSLQSKLPRLPIPELKDTCEKYLRTIQPLLSPEEFEQSKAAVAEFVKPGGIGEILQQKLKEHDQSGAPSWLEGWWDDSYLYGRESIAINVNYFFAFEDDPIKENNTQIGRAASLLRGALVFKQLLDSEKLEPDMERDKPLCMSQYPRLFGATRIPGKDRDKLVTYTGYRPEPGSGSESSKTTEYSGDSRPNHVVVLYRNQFYWFDVFVDDELISLEEIESYFHQVIQQTHASKDIEPPVGVFTAQDRPYWAEWREKLIQEDPIINLNTLEKIQSALIIVCLDSASPNSWDEVSRLSLHGPITNRWFDKHQLIVAANGKAGMTFEHAVGDGSTTLRLADEMYKYSVSHIRSLTGTLPVNPVKLSWKLNDNIMNAIEESYDVFKNQILANESSTLIYDKFGGQFIKNSNMSPDAFVQMAIQLAYYKMWGRCDPTYESAATKQFLHGRTETVRSVSNESVAFVKSASGPIIQMKDGKPIETEQYKLLQSAVQSHVKYMRDSKDGKGVDRHLFGLRMIFESNKDKLLSSSLSISSSSLSISSSSLSISSSSLSYKPSIFTDKAYKLSSHWNLSTSHCGSSSLSLFGFGPVVQDGIGIGYMIKNDSISFNITSKRHSPESSSESSSESYQSSIIFKSLLEESLLRLYTICISSPSNIISNHSIHNLSSLHFTHPTSSADFNYLDWQPRSPPKDN